MTDTETSGGASGPTWLVNHLPVMLWQRRYLVLASLVAFLAAAGAAALLMPTTYRSSATLLVQSQDLPTTLVDSPTNGAIDQRVARIREQVLSRGDLIQLIEENDLYQEERRSEPLSKIIEKMRHATSVGALAGDIGQQSNSQDNTVAISMSYEYRDAVKAQAVLQSFVTKFLNMDNAAVEDQANLTVRFLQDQATKLQSQIADVEGQLTALKARNGAALASSGAPPLIDTGSFSAQIASLQNENRQLIAQARRPAQQSSALASAQAALAAAEAQYNDSHPDVIALKQKVAQLQSTSQSSGADSTIQEEIAGNNAAIRQLMDQRDSTLSRANAAMAGQARAPAIQEEAMQLENKASALRTQYQQISENLLKAQNSARMASEQRAEHLSLVEPASLPDRPYSPNRPLILALGAAAGLGLGLLLALALELIGRPVRSPRQIQDLGYPVIGLVPVLKTETRRPGRWRRLLSREKRLAA